MSSSSTLELGNILAKAFIGSLKIEKHPNDEKRQLLESLRRVHQPQRRINNSSQDGSELKICGAVNGVKNRRTTEIMGRTASWWATFGFSLFSFSLKYCKPVLQAQQPPHSLWLSIIAMLSFTLFACAATVMLLVGARFTHMQIIVMLIAFFSLLLA